MCKAPTPDWGKAVKKELIDRDMSVTDLANKLGLSREYVSSVLNGRLRSEHIKEQILDRLGMI